MLKVLEHDYANSLITYTNHGGRPVIMTLFADGDKADDKTGRKRECMSDKGSDGPCSRNGCRRQVATSKYSLDMFQWLMANTSGWVDDSLCQKS